jgi:hypothetical protein
MLRWITASALLLALCAHNALAEPALSGESAASAALKQDILKTAQKRFEAATDCARVDHIEIGVQNIRMMFSKKILNGKTLHPLPAGGFLLDGQEIPPHGYVQENDETWQMSGCGNSRMFHVKIFGDDTGNTYFGVAEPGMIP